MKRILSVLCFFSLVLCPALSFSEPKSSASLNYEKKEILLGYPGEVLSIAFSPDGKIMAIGTSDKKVVIWDVATWKIIKLIDTNDDRVTALAFSPDGKILASGDRRNMVYFLDTAMWKTVSKMKAYSDIESLSFNQDGSLLAIACGREKAMLWDVQKNQLRKDLVGHTGDVKAIAFSPDGTQVATGGRDNSVIIWNSSTGEKIRMLPGHVSTVEKITYSPDGKHLVSGGSDNVVMIWDVASGKAVHRLSGHSDRICALEYLPQTNILMSGSCRIFLGPFFRPSYVAGSGCNVIFWNTEIGKQMKILETDCSLSCATFSADAKYFAVGNAAGSGQFITVYERK